MFHTLFTSPHMAFWIIYAILHCYTRSLYQRSLVAYVAVRDYGYTLRARGYTVVVPAVRSLTAQRAAPFSRVRARLGIAPSAPRDVVAWRLRAGPVYTAVTGPRISHADAATVANTGLTALFRNPAIQSLDPSAISCVTFVPREHNGTDGRAYGSHEAGVAGFSVRGVQWIGRVYIWTWLSFLWGGLRLTYRGLLALGAVTCVYAATPTWCLGVVLMVAIALRITCLCELSRRRKHFIKRMLFMLVVVVTYTVVLPAEPKTRSVGTAGARLWDPTVELWDPGEKPTASVPAPYTLAFEDVTQDKQDALVSVEVEEETAWKSGVNLFSIALTSIRDNVPGVEQVVKYTVSFFTQSPAESAESADIVSTPHVLDVSCPLFNATLRFGCQLYSSWPFVWRCNPMENATADTYCVRYQTTDTLPPTHGRQCYVVDVSTGNRDTTTDACKTTGVGQFFRLTGGLPIVGACYECDLTDGRCEMDVLTLDVRSPYAIALEMGVHTISVVAMCVLCWVIDSVAYTNTGVTRNRVDWVYWVWILVLCIWVCAAPVVAIVVWLIRVVLGDLYMATKSRHTHGDELGLAMLELLQHQITSFRTGLVAYLSAACGVVAVGSIPAMPRLLAAVGWLKTSGAMRRFAPGYGLVTLCSLILGFHVTRLGFWKLHPMDTGIVVLSILVHLGVTVVCLWKSNTIGYLVDGLQRVLLAGLLCAGSVISVVVWVVFVDPANHARVFARGVDSAGSSLPETLYRNHLLGVSQLFAHNPDIDVTLHEHLYAFVLPFLVVMMAGATCTASLCFARRAAPP
jgi:hypothetical protein